MRRIVAVALLAALTGWPIASNANVIEAFAFSGSLQDGAVISGELLIDVTVGVVTGSSVMVGPPDNQFFPIVSAQLTQAYSPTTYGVNVRNAALTEDFDFSIDGISLIGYTGGSVPLGFLFDLTTLQDVPNSGIVTAALTEVPEPGSLALLSVAAAGFIFLKQKRQRRT
jgi:hypothetical protein